MSIPRSEIERIEAAVTVENFITVSKRLKGGTVLQALCPFHQEKTPSFSYNTKEHPAKPDVYYCQGCKVGGKGVFQFYAHLKRLPWPGSFPAILEELGARPEPRRDYRIRPARGASPAPPDTWPAIPPPEVRALYRVAAEVWVRNRRRPICADVRHYLRDVRGVPDWLVEQQWIGYAMDSLAGELARRRLSLELAQERLLLWRDGHEAMAGRVIFPIWALVDGVPDIVGVTARVIPGTAWGDKTRKYLNTRGEGERIVAGYDDALRSGRADCAVVEGPFDRLAILSFGEDAVFIGSNTPSEGMYSQLRSLARTKRLYLFADSDRAGRKGTLRLIVNARFPHSADIYRAHLVGIKDPGTLIEGGDKGPLYPDGAAIYRAARAAARRIDVEMVVRRAHCYHAIVERRRLEAYRRDHAVGLARGHAARDSA